MTIQANLLAHVIRFRNSNKLCLVINQIKKGLAVKGKIQEVQGLQVNAIDLKVNAVRDQEVNEVNNDLEVDVLLARDSNHNRDRDHLVRKVKGDLEATSDLTRQKRQEVDLDLGVIVKGQ